MDIKMSDLSPQQAYHTMTQTIIPRPIAWILTQNKNNSLNLAPFSYFCGVCSDPPIIMISFGKRPDGSQKDTLVNIRERNDFVLHIPSKKMAADLSESSRGLPPEESEIDAIGLKTIAMPGSSLPRLVDCKIAYSGELYEIQEMGKGPQYLMFGKLNNLYLADEITSLKEKERLKVDAHEADILARLGGDQYCGLNDIFSIQRPIDSSKPSP